MSNRGISVVLPARLAGKHLRLAAKSILKQLDPVEDELLLLIDSDDRETLTLGTGIDSSFLRVIEMPPASSLATKLNRGIRESKNGLIARMDADDISLPWRLERQKRLYLQRGGVVFSTAIVFGSELRPIPLLPQPPMSLEHSEFLECLIFKNPGVHPTMMAAKQDIEDIGGYREVPGEDLDLWLRLAIRSKNLYRDWLPTLLYRYSRTSMSHGASNSLATDADLNARPLRIKLLQKLLGREFDESLNLEQNFAAYQQIKKLSWKVRMEGLDLGLNK